MQTIRVGSWAPILACAAMFAAGMASGGPPPAADEGKPVETTVFEPARDGFKSIRIPSVVVSKTGVVLAFAEGRAADADQARNKIVLKRSRDGGATWDGIQIVADDGDRALNNPLAVVEGKSGRVLLMYQSYPADVGERSGRIEPGYEGERIVRCLVVSSDDEGATWSEPRDVTRQAKRPERVTTIAGGPGIGVQLRRGKHAGRIVMPFNEGPFGAWNIYAVYSDDSGDTWKRGEPAPGGIKPGPQGKPTSLVNEAQLVELSDGSLRFNVRRWGGAAVRKTATSRDGGATWSSVEDVPELRDPGCMGSVVRLPDAADGAARGLLFSGPQGAGRENGTVFLSTDDGKTWPVRRTIQPKAFAYSCLTVLPDGDVGCLYESDDCRRIVFARFGLDWLKSGGEEAEAKPLPVK